MERSEWRKIVLTHLKRKMTKKNFGGNPLSSDAKQEKVKQSGGWEQGAFIQSLSAHP